MESEWNLSDKEYENTDCGIGEEVMSYWKADVREFIKRLKDDFVKNFQDACSYQLIHKKSHEETFDLMNDWFASRIDKLAGDKLI